MSIRLGINGFGRIGRAVTRILRDHPNMHVVAVNDLASPDQLAHALKYDSVYRRFPGEVYADGDAMIIDGHSVRVTGEKDPSKIDWRACKVDYVVEATGVFKHRADLEKHLSAGAAKVLLCVPPKDALDATVVLGVNDHLLKPEHRLVSNASCTTNAAAPLTKVIHDAFTIEHGLINTIHAYTNGQKLVDAPTKDWRRSRAAAMSIIPTTTGAAKAVGKAIPDLDGKLDGMAYRVPTPNGSVVDMIVRVAKPVTVDQVNATVKAAANGPLHGILAYEEDPIVSMDIIGDPHSSIFDSQLTQVMDGHLLKLVTWYDNEWGYANRVVDLLKKMKG